MARGDFTPRCAPRYDRVVIWGPFLLAVALGLVVSAGLYWAYLWPQVEPEDPPTAAVAVATVPPAEPVAVEPEPIASAQEPAESPPAA